MNETISNMNLLKDTIGKFKDEIQKFITNPQQATHNIISLKQNIENLEQDLIKKEKIVSKTILFNNSTFTSLGNKQLPQIHNFSGGFSNFNNKSNFFTKNQSMYKTDEKSFFKNAMMTRKNATQSVDKRKKDITKNNKKMKDLLQKHNFEDESKLKKIPRNVGNKNFMDMEAIRKYGSVNKYNNQVQYDENNQPIISQNEIEKGLLNMIYRGIIPKSADLTPAIYRNGCPLKLNNNLTTKTKKREEIDTECNYDNTKYNCNQDQLGKSSNLFLTDKLDRNNRLSFPKNLKKSAININEKKIDEEDDSKKLENALKNNPNKSKQEINMNDNRMKSDNSESEVVKISKPKLIIIFSNFKAVNNVEFKTFQSQNVEKWGVISYILEHIQKLLKKLNINITEVDGEKVVQLATDELKIIGIKDFVNCLTEKEIIKNGFNKPQKVFANIREVAATIIQKFYRMFKTVSKIRTHLIMIKYSSKIQKAFRLLKLRASCKKLINQINQESDEYWNKIMEEFKNNWKDIKNSKRIEIHINSISNSAYRNSTVDKFTEKENIQLSRLISLADPNLEIIYVCPFKLEQDIIAYYFSILNTLGIENIKERFHLIVPDITILPTNFSLSHLLYFSTKSLKEISNIINGKTSYIVPGTPNAIDLNISKYLQIPILMQNLEGIESIFNKSGCKRIFELTGLALPISSWDIFKEDDFYKNLTFLISNFLSVNIWIFKINNEHSGRGIAYINLEKIKSFIELKNEKLDTSIDDDKFENLLTSILKRSLPNKVEIICPKLYRSWSEFMQEYCLYGGVIEACPTNSLTGIIGSPSVSFLIEPDGNIDFTCSYDKINFNYFRNISAITPQIAIPNLNTEALVQKVGKYLYEQGIIGYTTIEFITFNDNQKTLFWAIDLKYGLNEYIASIKFCDFLYNQSKFVLNNSNSSKFPSQLSLNFDNDLDPHYIITPFMSNHNIAMLKMKDFVHLFRSEMLVYDLERKNGIVFLLPDLLQCGLIGLCIIGNNVKECLKIFEESLNIIKSKIFSKDYKPLNNDSRTDYMELTDSISKNKIFIKHMLKQ